MALVRNTYGKGRVRVMRVKRGADRHEVRELQFKAMVEGDFAKAYTHADNSTSLCTDTVKNLINIVASENLGASTEELCGEISDRFFAKYPQVERTAITAHETKWERYIVDGKPHPHGFLLDPNGKPIVELSATRSSRTLRSGIEGFTFLKSTESGWSNFFDDDYTTLAPTDDRIASTAMNAMWTWSGKPADYGVANAKILKTALDVFMTTYSKSVQDSLYRMGEAVLAAMPEIADINMACPNKHYIPMNLKAFGIEFANQIFLPTDEPHGQIECTVAR